MYERKTDFVYKRKTYRRAAAPKQSQLKGVHLRNREKILSSTGKKMVDDDMEVDDEPNGKEVDEETNGNGVENMDVDDANNGDLPRRVLVETEEIAPPGEFFFSLLTNFNCQATI